jgi:hypothetical protein
MPNSARALGQHGLRLRSRRARVDRLVGWGWSPIGFAVLLVTAGLVGFSSARIAELTLPPVAVTGPDWLPTPPNSTHLASRVDEQRYLIALQPIHARLEQSVLNMGLVAAAYRDRDLDRQALRAHLETALATLRRTEEQLRALQPPPELQGDHDSYLDALRLFERSAQELLLVTDDSPASEDHFAVAFPLSLEAAGRIHQLGSRFWR